MKSISDATNALRDFFALKYNAWVKWIAVPNDTQDDCDKFNGCFFSVKQMPRYPQHINCKCLLIKIPKPIPDITANANCDIRKFSGYIFSDKYDDGKKELFESWGYNTEDSLYLKKTYIAQALKNYCNGEYKYIGTNDFCAKISIEITLFNKYGDIQLVKTIWQLSANGEITLITPYSGHTY